MTEQSGCSVIVCCYNSSERLLKTLSHISLQNLSQDQKIEVLLVDNASTDFTSEVAQQVWRDLKTPFPLRIITEINPGLSNARRAGVLQAMYDTIVFCDDDNWLCSDYVSLAIEIMSSCPNVGILGGRHLPAFESDLPPPAWFYTYGDGYAVGVQALQTGDISGRGYVWGAGMVLRASLLRQMYMKGLEPLLSGRFGAKMLSGDDSEIWKWYLIAGYQLWFDDRLSLSHFIPSNRLTKEYVARLHEGFGCAGVVLGAYNALLYRRRALTECKRRPLALLRSHISFLKLAGKLRQSLAEIEKIAVASRISINC